MAIPETRNLSYQGANLPQVTEADDGKVLGVVGGKWVVKDDESGSVLPETTASDVGKSLMVDADGNWVKDNGTVTITLSEIETAAFSNLVQTLSVAAAQDRGAMYANYKSGGISEANFKRIIEALDAGKKIELKIGMGDDNPIILAPTFFVSNGAMIGSSGFVNFNNNRMSLQVTFRSFYDNPPEGEEFIYFAYTDVSVCIPKATE